jgi:flagellar basal-body rod modification protein FlgD
MVTTTDINNAGISSQASKALSDAAKETSFKQDENASKSELDGKKLADDFDEFLLLLTTQLKNQDPTDPLDTNEFTQQLVSFSGVEQQVNTNKNLEKLIASSVNSGVQQGLGYIGKTIEAVGDKGVLEGGEGYFTYELPSTVAEATVSILDSTGRAVFSGQGSTNAGKTVAYWDGKNSFTNQQMPDGTYQLIVTAKGFQNEAVEAKTFTTGRVNAVETNADNEVVLNVGTQKVKLSDISSVREQPTSVNIADNNAIDEQDDSEQEASN